MRDDGAKHVLKLGVGVNLRIRQPPRLNPAEGGQVASLTKNLRPPSLKKLLAAPGVVSVLDLDSARHDRGIIPSRRGPQRAKRGARRA